jgi:hypothetical protein
MTTLTLNTRKVRPANTAQYYIPRRRTGDIKVEIGTIIAPVSPSKKHEIAFNWVADNAEVLIREHDIEPARAILSFAGQAESKHHFTWLVGASEWQRIAASGVDGVRAKARDTKYLKSLDD